jgi:protein gp37
VLNEIQHVRNCRLAKVAFFVKQWGRELNPSPAPSRSQPPQDPVAAGEDL